MNQGLKEINEIIALCNRMTDVTQKNGYIKTSHEDYRIYCEHIDSFCTAHNLKDLNYAPFAIIGKYWTNSLRATLYPSEIAAIKQNLILIKHTLFENAYEKIFISHREKDADQVYAFVELLHAIGIPRPTREMPESVIFCTSHPEGYIENGKRNLDEIRDKINTDEHVLYVLWYTDRYFESPACLNEAGAIWAMKKKYQEILMPNFNEKKINGLLDKQPVWFRANDKMRLNTFREQIEEMFALTSITPNAWETARDKFIDQINGSASEKEELCEQ